VATVPDWTARLVGAARRRVATLPPLRRRRERFNLHQQASASWHWRAERSVEMWLQSAPDVPEGRPLAVADLGAGNERLRTVLADKVDRAFAYHGYDLQPQRPTVRRIDLRSALPDRRFDVVFCLGVLEYLPDVAQFLERLHHVTPVAVVSYTVADAPERLSAADREARGWQTNYAREQLSELSRQAGWSTRDFSLIDRDRTGIWLWEAPARE
jgi:trans-aconitate methyltransferase